MPHGTVVRRATSAALSSTGFGAIGSRVGGRLVELAVEQTVTHQDIARARRDLEQATGFNFPDRADSLDDLPL